MSINPVARPAALGPADPPGQNNGSVQGNALAAGLATAGATAKPAVPAHKAGAAQVLAQEAAGIDDLRLRIERDAGSGQFVYFGVNPKTGEVVRQYPPKEVLARIAFYRKAAGLTGGDAA